MINFSQNVTNALSVLLCPLDEIKQVKEHLQTVKV